MREEKTRMIALAGNPNCGKSTLFNRLTRENAHVGNWPGVTVERKQGKLRTDANISLVDLPGLYSLTAYTEEEKVSRKFLLTGEMDIVLNLLDGRSLERGLYLTLQLLELGCPMLVAVGMLDEVAALGGQLDCGVLSQSLGRPVLQISPRSGQGSEALTARLRKGGLQGGQVPHYARVLEEAAEAICDLLRSSGVSASRLLALSLLEGQTLAEAGIAPQWGMCAKINALRKALERKTGEDAASFIASERYRWIERTLQTAARPLRREDRASRRMDNLLLHRVLALPLFAGIMALLFGLCFAGPGLTAKSWLETQIGILGETLAVLLPAWGVSPPMQELLCEGVLGGVGMVLCFLPQIALLFFCLTFLEECGYLARAAFLMDMPLRKLGLTGQSFIPLLMGFGCSTPAIMAARTLPGERNRQTTIRLIPYLSCGAKLPVYALFAGAFFPAQQGLAVALCYLTGVVAAICCGFFWHQGTRREAETPFLVEQPPYRLPSPRTLLRNTAEKCTDFIRRAGTLLFVMSLLLWLLRHLDAGWRFLPDGGGDSLFSLIGGLLAPLFRPLGFGFQEAVVALLAGGAAKEAIVSTFGVLCGAAGSMPALSAALQTLFTPLSAASFLVFCSLYAPCISALATMRRELGSTAAMLCAAAAQTAVAYGAALAVYQCGLLVERFL